MSEQLPFLGGVIEMSFDELESKIGLPFANRNLLTETFTHGSTRGKPQSRDSETYRRLEFLGDAVLRLAVSESVFRDSDRNVETLHEEREKLVSNGSLAGAAKDLGLSKYLRGSGSGDVIRSGLVHAQLYESLTGAIFVDRGYETASKFVEETLIREQPDRPPGSSTSQRVH
jgi:ribonuclease-3